MPNVSNQLPEELLRVEEIHVESLTSSDPRMAATSFIVELGRAVTKHIASSDPQIQLCLVKNWLRHHQYCLEHQNIPELTVTAMDRCVGILMCNTALALFTKTSDERQLLATFAVRRAYLYKHGLVYQQDVDLRAMLQKWTNQQLSYEDICRPEDVVRLLYGDTCWELLGADVEWEIDLPRVLWEAKPPLVLDKTKSAGIMIPEDVAE